ncbi:putative virion structural protein [Xanthomonas phage Xoo-sp14]|nr:putative virion structural protein [Xanthomonas phage Xoo-sp14]
MDVCPLAKSGSELILDLINSENGTTITEEQLVFGEPTASTEDGNTELNVAAAEDSPWNKFVDVKYDRLDLATLFAGQDVSVSVPKEATAADIICHLNFTYDLSFKIDEFELLPQDDGAIPEPYKLRAKGNNLAYTGEFPLFVDLERMPLSARILKTELEGFHYPNADVPSWNNVIYTDGPIVDGLQTYGANNGDVVLDIQMRGYPVTYPTTINGDPKGAIVQVGGPIGSGSYRFPQMIVGIKAASARNLVQLMDEYDFTLEMGSINGKVTLKPVLQGNGRVIWQGDGVTDGMNVSGDNVPAYRSYAAFSFEWDYAVSYQQHIQPRLITLGMSRGSGGGGSAGTTGVLIVTLRGKHKTKRSKEIVLTRTMRR